MSEFTLALTFDLTEHCLEIFASIRQRQLIPHIICHQAYGSHATLPCSLDRSFGSSFSIDVPLYFSVKPARQHRDLHEQIDIMITGLAITSTLGDKTLWHIFIESTRS